jgi:hypothetical protein
VSGEDGEEGVAVEPVAEPVVEPDAEPEAEPLAPPEGGVLELEDGEDDGGVLEVEPAFFEASSPQAARVNAAAAAISRALVIPVPLWEWGRNSMPPKMTFHPWGRVVRMRHSPTVVPETAG